jgi:Macrocin-O-methyltransferase (TylF)
LYRIGQYRPPNKISHFYAFDSFEGMPEPIGIDRQKIWRKGMNLTTLDTFKAICKRDLHRITIVPGFFSESLPSMKWNDDHRIALAYIDVDFYRSAKEALAFIADKLQHGSIIAFDDWNCYYADPIRGERRAFAEWQESLSAVARFEPLRGAARASSTKNSISSERLSYNPSYHVRTSVAAFAVIIGGLAGPVLLRVARLVQVHPDNGSV